MISPWVAKAGVSTTVYDHTSIIKTILARFCRKPDGPCRTWAHAYAPPDTSAAS